MKYSHILFAASAFVLAPYSSAFADTNQQAVNNTNKTDKTDKTENDSELDQIEVSYTTFAQEMGTQKLDSIDIERLPTKNGTVSELLKSNPNVRFQEFSDSSLTQGEIAPENVSFHGERFYNNLWLIDGLSNNDNIHPGSKNGRTLQHPDGASDDELPGGGTQSFWINSDIIDSVNVYDSNISAKYGQFTGGVIDAKLKNASTDKITGSVSYRTTRDRWTKFHIYGEDEVKQKKNENEFYSAESLFLQPRFTKHNYAFNVNVPINNNNAVIFSYNRATSTIPFFHRYKQEWEKQRRQSENILIKGTHNAVNGDTFNASLMYSPHSSKYFRNSGSQDSYSNNGGGFSTEFSWNHLLDNGSLDTSISYKKSGNEIEHDTAMWIETCNNFTFSNRRKKFLCYPSDKRRDGGFGKYHTSRTSFTLKQDLKFDSVKWGTTEHQISMGWKADFAKGEYNRKQDVIRFGAAQKDDTVICAKGDSSCIDGQQYSGLKVVAKKRDIKVGNNHYSLYFEDNIKWKRLEFTPGIRVDYDEYLGNTNIAPRFTTSLDVFADGNTKLFAGVNRYYADSMLRHALSDQLRNETRYSRKVSRKKYKYQPWGQADEKLSDRSFGGDVKTPYSDEINLGIKQVIAGTEWTAKWVNRKSKDQFSTRVEKYKYPCTYLGKPSRRPCRINMAFLENNGGGSSNSLTITGSLIKPFESKFTNISWNLGASYTKSKSNFDYNNTVKADYDEGMNPESDEDKIIFDGKIVNKEDMPALNFNTPWKVFTNINFDFPQWNLNWTNRLNYSAGYDSYAISRCSGRNAPDICKKLGYEGDWIDVYEKASFPKRFTLDWHFSYKPPVPGGNFELSLDVLNVLDTTVESSLPYNSHKDKIGYKSGRQFWLGAKYSW